MAAKSKFGLQNLVSTPPAAGPDDLLLGTSEIVARNTADPAAGPEKIRFTNTLPAATFRRLHQLAFWAREDMSSILDAALTAYFAQHPEADQALPEKEALRRKLR
jgi:hypothetical protein